MDNIITLPCEINTSTRDEEIMPFSSNSEFLEEKFREYRLLAECSALRRNTRPTGTDPTRDEPVADVATKATQYERLCAKNEERALASGCTLPFVNLTRSCGLNETARHVLWLLFFQTVAADFDAAQDTTTKGNALADGERLLRARDIVRILAPDSLHEQMKIARHFGVDSPLVKYRLIEICAYEARTFLDIELSIPARVAKYIADDDTEYDIDNAFIIERPEVPLSFAVLPEDQKRRIVSFIENHERSMKKQEELGLDKVLTYGRGLAILLYGPPGTGKTLLAKAIATYTNKPLLSIRSPNASLLGGISDRYVGADDIEELFREARMREGIVFLDECEQYCSKNNYRHYTVLREIEHTDCIVILTANSLRDLSPALDRRIALKVHFQLPDASSRRQIWDMHLPRAVQLAPDVNLDEIAEKYQMAGGYIKNAVLSAINLASSRNGNGAFALTADDLREGARLQQKHVGSLNGLVVHVEPVRGISDLVLSGEMRETVHHVLKAAMNHRSLLSSIRFINSSVNRGYKVLLFGSSFQSALDSVEAIARELNTGLAVIPFGKVISQSDDFGREDADFLRSRAHEVMSLAATTGQILVLTDPERSMDTLQDDNLTKAAEFLSHFRDHDGIMFMVSASRTPRPVLLRLFHRCIYFDVIPAPERLRCWETVTEGTPLAEDVDLQRIAEDYELGPEEIQNALYIACLLSAGESQDGKISGPTLRQGIKDVLRRETGVARLFGTVG